MDNKHYALIDYPNEQQSLGGRVDPVVMCFDCMIAAGYKRDEGFHTAAVKHCVACDTEKSILPKRHWSK